MASEKPEARALLAQLAEKEEMQMAEALLNQMSRDSQEWENQYGYERFVHDCISREKYAFMKGENLGIQQGLTQGLKQGAESTKIANAKNLLKLGVTPETIAQGCSLPLEQVLALKDEVLITH